MSTATERVDRVTSSIETGAAFAPLTALLAAEAYSVALAAIRDVGDAFKAGAFMSASDVHSAVLALIEAIDRDERACLALSDTKSLNEYLVHHSANVAVLSLVFATRITTSGPFRMALGTAALLHDLGEFALDGSIIYKPEMLTPEEWELIRSHPLRGSEGASRMPGIDPAAVTPIAEHHMRFDLSGYPRRERPLKQSLAARIIAIADTYDAMTSPHAYCDARPSAEALALLEQGAGTAFDPALVPLFAELIEGSPRRFA